MIKVRCPRCKQVHKVPRAVAGSTMPCTACGQQLKVPVPHDAKTYKPHSKSAPRPGGGKHRAKLATKRCAHVVCPNKKCGYHGPALRTPKCNKLIALGLCLLGLIPGLVYMCIKSGAMFTCPECGRQIAET